MTTLVPQLRSVATAAKGTWSASMVFTCTFDSTNFSSRSPLASPIPTTAFR